MRSPLFAGPLLAAAAMSLGADPWLDPADYSGARYRPKRKKPPQHPTNKRAKVKAGRKAAKRNRA